MSELRNNIYESQSCGGREPKDDSSFLLPLSAHGGHGRGGEEEVRVRHVPLPPRKRGGEAGEGERRTAECRQTDGQTEGEWRRWQNDSLIVALCSQFQARSAVLSLSLLRFRLLFKHLRYTLCRINSTAVFRGEGAQGASI